MPLRQRGEEKSFHTQAKRLHEIGKIQNDSISSERQICAKEEFLKITEISIIRLAPKRILFLSLYTFSLTGGIEKVCRIFNEVLAQLQVKSLNLAMHDTVSSKRNNYRAFASHKVSFAYHALKNGLSYDVILLSHINLLFFAKIIRRINPHKKVILFAHGIEVWDKLPAWKKDFLNQIEIWAVSRYTAQQLENIHQVKPGNIKVLNNCLENGFDYTFPKARPLPLIEKYQLCTGQKVILTVCRLSSAEQYKGYDLVLLALKDLIKIQGNLKYFIVGQADGPEKSRIENLINVYQLQNHVVLTGYVDNQELKDFYQLADIFAMPSKGEGFGTVFLEAIANGCRVLAGNADGSTDALLHGELGLLVDPENVEEIYQGLTALLKNPVNAAEIAEKQEKLKAHFSFEVYKEKVKELLFID